MCEGLFGALTISVHTLSYVADVEIRHREPCWLPQGCTTEGNSSNSPWGLTLGFRFLSTMLQGTSTNVGKCLSCGGTGVCVGSSHARCDAFISLGCRVIKNNLIPFAHLYGVMTRPHVQVVHTSTLFRELRCVEFIILLTSSTVPQESKLTMQNLPHMIFIK